MADWRVLHGDCLDVLKTLPDCSIDAVVTDPPAGIGFMGKAWDRYTRHVFIDWLTEVMAECLRVLKPGAHALVWALPRTSHWTAMAVEDAGFEVRDKVVHLFGQGFPKSLDVSKAIDKMAGVEREVIGVWRPTGTAKPRRRGGHGAAITTAACADYERYDTVLPLTAPATDAARQWQGWGTALKPAAEDWILARKPLAAPNVASNVLEWGTGAIHVDGCRVGYQPDDPRLEWQAKYGGHDYGDAGNLVYGAMQSRTSSGNRAGRWPANVVLSHHPDCNGTCHPECAVRSLDEQSGDRGGGFGISGGNSDGNGIYGGRFPRGDRRVVGYGDTGTASRFFYIAKASRAEREAGLEGLTERPSGVMQDDAYRWEHNGRGNKINLTTKARNHHPTVKSIALMRWLCRLITPPGGTVLDQFTGSGSTGCAAMLEGFSFIGIEREAEYVEIARRRIAHWAGEDLPLLQALRGG